MSCYQNDLWSNKKIHIFSIFSKFCDVRVKKFWNFFFFKLNFLLTRPILWLNSSSKTKFQLNWVTRRELGAILHSISWFVLSPSSQNMNISTNMDQIWTKNDCKCIFGTKSCYQNDLWSDKKFHFFFDFFKILWCSGQKIFKFFFLLHKSFW